MPVLQEHPVDAIYRQATALTLWQIIVLGGWITYLLIWKLIDLCACFLWRWLVLTTTPGAPECFEAAANRSSYGSTDLFSTPSSEQTSDLEQETLLGDLVLALPDRLVADELWPRFARNPATIFQLRGVNRRWRSLVDLSIEWKAVNYVLNLEHAPRLGETELSDQMIAQELGLEVERFYEVLDPSVDRYDVLPPLDVMEGYY